jgi:hypothetical protein
LKKGLTGVKNTILLTLMLLLGASVAFGQATPAAPQSTGIAGSYEGTVKGQPVTLEVKTVEGKLQGQLKTAEKSYELTGGAVNGEGLVSLNFGKDAKLDGKTDGAKITGDWIVGAEKSPIELKKSQPAAVPAAAANPANPAPAVNLNGDTVTGGSSSQLGEATIKNGTWKDGKLAITLAGSSGDIVMAATVVEGKLTGEFDYAGQLQGKWVAVRKQ